MELEWSKNGECFGLSLDLHVQHTKAFCFISASSTTFPHATSTARSNEPRSRDRLEVRPIYWLFESLGPAWIIVARNKKQEVTRDVIQVQCQKKKKVQDGTGPSHSAFLANPVRKDLCSKLDSWFHMIQHDSTVLASSKNETKRK